MAFIPCTTGAIALYKVLDDEQRLALAVEAWDETGAPYVAGEAVLVRADSLPGFVRLEAAWVEVPRPDRRVRQPDRVGPRPAQVEGGRPRERERP
ncbi:hypothetical protein [Nonomuraea sp. bgisy101]|uniref:hypothetical protein n=1 Tax=Nonomuraea sp. bgisy101 TaxID=3413784 RepID=UPI003D724FAF